MDEVRIGIAGIGGMGSNHATYLSRGEVPQARLTAVSDTGDERLTWAQQTLGESVSRFDDAEAMICSGQVDAVIVATPHYFHPPIAIAAFEAGLHVMSEKPAGVYTRQVKQMNEAAIKSGKVFGLMLNQRARGTTRKLQELVASGELGEIRRTNYIITSWFRAQSYYDSGGWRATWAGEGGGVLANQCPHNLDLWQWICGMPSRMRAFCHFGKHHEIEVEDDVTAYVEYPNGASGVFVTTTGDAPGTNRLEITGDRGKIVAENNKITFHRTESSVSQFLKDYPDGFGSPNVWTCDVPPSGGGGEHKAITTNWIQSILDDGKTQLMAPGLEGIHSVELFNAMLLSAWTDDWVDLPVDADLYYDQLQKRVATSKAKGGGGKTMDVSGTFQ
jgi:predicted dehydrogenase